MGINGDKRHSKTLLYYMPSVCHVPPHLKRVAALPLKRSDGRRHVSARQRPRTAENVSDRDGS